MRIRIDFRLVLAGLLILLVGVALFAVWLVLAVVSFFAFFVPPLHGIFYVALDLLAGSLFMMGAGVIVALSGARGWWGAGWSHGPSEEASRDRLKASQRVGELIGVVISLLVLDYFYQSQVMATGFFTSAFGQTEQLAFYGPIILGIAISLVRGVYGRKHAVRPLQSLQGAAIAVASAWLLYKFPFEFNHLTALLPHFLQVPFWWVSNPVGQLLFVLGIIGGLVSMAAHAAMYATSR
ncbi:MAG TPA: hypothetical protein VEC92_01170 [Nitrososphaerales archaeon]|nr:hypothetical protein [Nitrososphaerales archaeon]